jgi:hypothetical protein
MTTLQYLTHNLDPFNWEKDDTIPDYVKAQRLANIMTQGTVVDYIIRKKREFRENYEKESELFN